MAPAAGIIALQPETVLAFDVYVRTAEKEIKTALGCAPSLWSEGATAKLERVYAGEIVARLWAGDHPVAVPHGLIHDWIGAAFVSGVTTPQVLSIVQAYNDHKNIYQPDVLDSRLMSRRGDDFEVFLRLLKKIVITIVLDTVHEVHYDRAGSGCFCRSRTTRISEVQDAGKANETSLAPDIGHGFLWRLCSFWNFQETNNGTLIECRAISLTRDIPLALKWMIQPIVRSLPKESLIATLSATRRRVLQQFSTTPGLADTQT